MIGQGEQGWIKLSRKIVNHWIWGDAERLKWWLDLLMMAAWEDRQVMHDSHLITLRRGQMIASVGFLRDRWKRSHQTILRFLNLIEKEDMIKRSMMYRQTSIITICNYESYQVNEDARFDTIMETIEDTQVETIVYTNKEDKEYNIYNNNSSSLHSDESEVRELHADPSERDEKKIEEKAEESGNAESPKQADLFNEAGFVRYWNEEMEANGAIVRRIRSLSGSRKKWINARIREHGKEAVMEVVRKVARSDFLNGKNGRSWTATFDWVFGVNNFQKVMEGNFDNDSSNQVKSIGNESNNDKERRFDKRRGYDAVLHEVSDYETGF